jgi:D-beta-D-heptose 7-phosphate kinase/D-beta-D-heptose 1-phosphate adenosyltransferase
MVDSDERVKQLKGNSRPINTQYERSTLLRGLRWVDEVKVFSSDDELERSIEAYSPDIMVKGSDYAGKYIIGAQHCKAIIFYDRIEDYSSTKKIQDIANR